MRPPILRHVFQICIGSVKGNRLHTYLLETPILGLLAIHIPRLLPAWGHRQQRRGEQLSSPGVCWNSWRSSSQLTPVVAIQDAKRKKKKRRRCNLDPISEKQQYLITKPAQKNGIRKWLNLQSCFQCTILTHLPSLVSTIPTLIAAKAVILPHRSKTI